VSNLGILDAPVTGTSGAQCNARRTVLAWRTAESVKKWKPISTGSRLKPPGLNEERSERERFLDRGVPSFFAGVLRAYGVGGPTIEPTGIATIAGEKPTPGGGAAVQVTEIVVLAPAVTAPSSGIVSVRPAGTKIAAG
jgi:hypothetical protein